MRGTIATINSDKTRETYNGSVVIVNVNYKSVSLNEFTLISTSEIAFTNKALPDPSYIIVQLVLQFNFTSYVEVNNLTIHSLRSSGTLIKF